MKRGLLTAFLLSLPVAAAEPAGPMSDLEALELFTSASTRYKEASDLPRNEGEKAIGLYREAAALYEQILGRGFEHSDIYYNLGNTYYKLNDLGRAILSYRRAQLTRPSDPDLAANIRTAKAKIIDDEPDRRPPELLRTLLFWYYDWSLGLLAKLALASYLFLCGAICVLIFFRAAPVRWLVKASAVLAVVLSLSFAWKLHQHRNHRVAVVLASVASVRTGYHDQETERFTVHSGTELLVEDLGQSRDGRRWLKVALTKELRGWIQGDAVAIVQEPPSLKLGGPSQTDDSPEAGEAGQPPE